LKNYLQSGLTSPNMLRSESPWLTGWNVS